jgi:hypothetical protein
MREFIATRKSAAKCWGDLTVISTGEVTTFYIKRYGASELSARAYDRTI